MKKIHNAYENFNKINSLVPIPQQFNNYVVHKYAFPKGLKSYKKEDIISESEAEFQERYTVENLEKLNLADRRKMLGSFQQQQGL